MRLLRAALAAALVSQALVVGLASNANGQIPYTGLGFDTCAAPSTATMAAWLASPYRSVGIYIGGANRACGDGNLSAGWVGSVEGQGWRLVPEYVGLQAPCAFQGGLAPIDPSLAALQGTQAADDAVARAANFGLGAGTPIYFDMEAYGSSCSSTVLDFLDSWTVELHNRGYVAGLYGSSASAIRDEANAFRSIHPVDDIFFANWNGTPNIFGDPFFPDNVWAYQQRLHQFSGNQTQSYGGVSIQIDQDIDEGAVVGQCMPNAPTCLTPIAQHYLTLGGQFSLLGPPITPEVPTPDGVGEYERFVNGYIYWSPYTGAHEVHGAILAHWAALGYERSIEGYPTTDETGTPDGIGRYNHFQDGSIYWTPQTGPWEVHGAIQGHWAALRWEASVVGYPVTDELGTPDGIGRYNHFQYGSIYWTPQTGAWEVHGAIQGHWAALRWEAGALGYPVTDETGTPDGIGRYNHVPSGSIYWTPQTGPWEVQGAIQAHWAALRWEAGLLGYPTSDETVTAGGGGRFNTFQKGNIYWSPATGAWAVFGALLPAYLSIGTTQSSLGYPTSDLIFTPVGVRTTFQHGYIDWNATTNQVTVTVT